MELHAPIRSILYIGIGRSMSVDDLRMVLGLNWDDGDELGLVVGVHATSLLEEDMGLLWCLLLLLLLLVVKSKLLLMTSLSTWVVDLI